MKHNGFLPIFLLLYAASIKPMELASNPSNLQSNIPKNIFESEDILGNFACQIATRNDGLESRIKDLRSFSCVSKPCNSAVNKYAGLIIELLAGNFKFSEIDSDTELDETQKKDLCEVDKVAIAIELGIKGSREWLAQEYSDEKQYKKLLFKLVKHPSCIECVSKLQYVNDFCNRIANEQTNALLRSLERVGVPNNLGMQILNTRKIRYASIKLNVDEVLDTILNEKIDQSLRLLLLKRIIKESPEHLNFFKFREHWFWCKAVDTQELPILKEILKHAARLTACRCSHEAGRLDDITPLEKMIIENRPDLVAEILKCPSITCNERGDSSHYYPLLMALRYGCLRIAQQLIFHHKCDVNIDYNNETPLIVCLEKSYLNEIMELLIAHPKCNVNKVGKQKRTPLMIAVLNGNEQAVDLLLGRPDLIIEAKDCDGNTAYDIAVSLGYGEMADKIKKVRDREPFQNKKSCFVM